MRANTVPGFLPSRYGFHFENRWPPGPARTLDVGPLHIPIGDIGRGLCGGMAFAARDRFERHEDAPPDAMPPKRGEALFREIVDRQFASFGSWFSVPVRFWLSSAGSQAARDRETVRDAWPAIRASIDTGVPPMIGLVRQAGWNPLAVRLGHQVAGYRYEETPSGISIWIYDPNHPGVDDVRITVARRAGGTYELGQSTGENLIGLLALPFERARPA